MADIERNVTSGKYCRAKGFVVAKFVRAVITENGPTLEATQVDLGDFKADSIKPGAIRELVDKYAQITKYGQASFAMLSLLKECSDHGRQKQVERIAAYVIRQPGAKRHRLGEDFIEHTGEDSIGTIEYQAGRATFDPVAFIPRAAEEMRAIPTTGLLEVVYGKSQTLAGYVALNEAVYVLEPKPSK